MPERSHIEEPVPVERAELDELTGERDRYKAALEWIAASNPAATESQIICALRALGRDEEF